MSKETLLAVWGRALPHAEKTVLAAIAYNADAEGNHAWPSVGTVARRAGYSPRQVHNIIGRLLRRGALVKVGRIGRDRGYITEYRIDLQNVPLLPDERTQSSQSLRTQSSRSMPDERVHSRSQRVKSATPKSETASADKQHLTENPEQEKRKRVAFENRKPKTTPDAIDQLIKDAASKMRSVTLTPTKSRLEQLKELFGYCQKTGDQDGMSHLARQIHCQDPKWRAPEIELQQ